MVGLLRRQPDHRRLHNLGLNQSGIVSCGVLGQDVGVGRAAGNQDICRHPSSFQLSRHGGNQGFVTCFGWPVGSPSRPVHGVHAGGHADDAAPLLRQHVGHHGPGHVEGPAEVDRNHLVPSLGRNLPEPGAVGRIAAGGDARVVQQDVDGSQALDGPGHCLLGILGVRDIGQHRDDRIVTADLSDVVGRLVQPFPVDVHHGNPGPGAHQGHGHGPANADWAGSPGDDGVLALKRSVHHGLCPPKRSSLLQPAP